MINALAAPVEAAWRELDEADQAAAAVPARVPLGALAPDMVRHLHDQGDELKIPAEAPLDIVPVVTLPRSVNGLADP